MEYKPNNIPARSLGQQPGEEHKMHPLPTIIEDSYAGSGKLKDKVALISGGDSGIGRAIAVHFTKEQADIAIIYLEVDKDARKTKEMVEKQGKRCPVLKGDLKRWAGRGYLRRLPRPMCSWRRWMPLILPDR